MYVRYRSVDSTEYRVLLVIHDFETAAAARAAFFRGKRFVSNSADGMAVESKVSTLVVFVFFGNSRTRSPRAVRFSASVAFGGVRGAFARL